MKDLLTAPSSRGLRALDTLCLYLLIRVLCHLVYNYINLCNDASWTCTSMNQQLFESSSGTRPIHPIQPKPLLPLPNSAGQEQLYSCPVQTLSTDNATLFLICFSNKNIHIISQIQMKSAPRFGVSNASRDEVHQFAHRHTEDGQKKPAVTGFGALIRISVFLLSIHII